MSCSENVACVDDVAATVPAVVVFLDNYLNIRSNNPLSSLPTKSLLAILMRAVKGNSPIRLSTPPYINSPVWAILPQSPSSSLNKPPALDHHHQSGALSLVQIRRILSSDWVNITMLAPRSMP